MKKVAALILAAGKGTRLRPYTHESPKSLFELQAGLSILEFIVKQLKEVGLEEIYVVVRIDQVAMFKEKVGNTVKIIAIGEEDFGNLYTVKFALDQIETEDVLLIMSDHIFEQEVVRRLLNSESEKSIVLCLDKEPYWEKIGEGLRVRLEGMDVKIVGKDIPPYSGIDTGLFLLKKKSFGLVSEVESFMGISSTIADLVNYSAEMREVGYVDVSGCLWADIDTPGDLVEARKLYWSIVRKDLVKPTDGPISRILNRPISVRLTQLLIGKNRIKPNHITIISFIIGIISSILFFWGHFVLGGMLTHVSSILDGVDGELARLRGEESSFGGFLDTVLDRFVDLALILALGTASVATVGTTWAIILTSLSSFGIVLVSYISKIANIDSNVLRSGFPWATRDVRLFTITVGGLSNFPLLPLAFCSFAPILFSVRAFLQYGRERKSRVLEFRPPYPAIDLNEGEESDYTWELRCHLTGLISNSAKLIIWLTAIRILSYAFRGHLEFDIGITKIGIDSILGFIRFTVVIYFGYRIIVSLKYFLDRFANLIVNKLEITGTVYSRTALDLLYLFSTFLFWLAISPIIESLPKIGDLLRVPIGLAFFVLFTLILYDFTRVFYRSLKGIWEKLVDRAIEAANKHLIQESP